MLYWSRLFQTGARLGQPETPRRPRYRVFQLVADAVNLLLTQYPRQLAMGHDLDWPGPPSSQRSAGRLSDCELRCSGSRVGDGHLLAVHAPTVPREPGEGGVHFAQVGRRNPVPGSSHIASTPSSSGSLFISEYSV